MKVFELIMALLLNILLILIEGATFLKVKNKRNILKFYTFLQNFIAFAVSILFCGFAIRELLGYGNVPELMKGLRYTATCGLTATMFVFAFFWHHDLNPEKVNLIQIYLED